MSRGRTRLRRHELVVHQADALAAAARVSTGKLTGRRSSEGDPLRIRGIPIQGAPGVSGTMLGTKPDGWIDRMRDA